MGGKSNLYRMRVAPGMLGDGTFGVYIIPADNTNLERQIASQLPSLEEAYVVANNFRYRLPGGQITAYITPDGALELPLNNPSELDQQLLNTLFAQWSERHHVWDRILTVNQPNYSTLLRWSERYHYEQVYSFNCLDENVEICKIRSTELNNNVYSRMSEEQLKASLTEYLNTK